MNLSCDDLYLLTIYWASETSPTLGCSIEISHDVHIICRHVCHGPKCLGAHAQSQFWAVKTDL